MALRRVPKTASGSFAAYFFASACRLRNSARGTSPASFCDMHLEIGAAGASRLVYFACGFQCATAMKLAACIGYHGPLKLYIDRKQIFADPVGTNRARGQSEHPLQRRGGGSTRPSWPCTRTTAGPGAFESAWSGWTSPSGRSGSPRRSSCPRGCREPAGEPRMEIAFPAAKSFPRTSTKRSPHPVPQANQAGGKPALPRVEVSAEEFHRSASSWSLEMPRLCPRYHGASSSWPMPRRRNVRSTMTSSMIAAGPPRMLKMTDLGGAHADHPPADFERP